MREARTLCQRVEVSGRGMHTGAPVAVELAPAPHPSGIRVRREGARDWIHARASALSARSRTLALGAEPAGAVGLEHVLAACHGLQVCCLAITIRGADDAPGLDGSAQDWVHAIDSAGLVACGGPAVGRRTAARALRSGRSSIRYDPDTEGDVLQIAYRVDFRVRGGDIEEVLLELDEASFRRELAAARTFSVRGVDRDPLPGVDGAALWTDTPASARRFPNELARHKALDLVGDLALVGWPIAGRVEADCAGHGLHQALAHALAEVG